MELMEIRRRLMMMAGGKIPAFMNHLESGSFSLDSGSEIDIALSKIDLPKGILVYSDAFDLDSVKADKPIVGVYMAIYIAGTNTLVLQDNVYYIQKYTMYATNWGQGVNNENPTWRSSRTESRGIRYIRPSNKTIHLNGFGTGEYDFKHNVTYNWIVWD